MPSQVIANDEPYIKGIGYTVSLEPARVESPEVSVPAVGIRAALYRIRIPRTDFNEVIYQQYFMVSDVAAEPSGETCFSPLPLGESATRTRQKERYCDEMFHRSSPL
ncbi:MAG: hypothetical protein WA734_15785 [Candidatus Acidiferrales bacterium]